MTVLIQAIWIINELFASVEICSIRKISSTIWIRKLETQLQKGQMQQAGKGCSFPELISVPQTKLRGSPSSQVGNKVPKQKEWDIEIGKHIILKLVSNNQHRNTIAAEQQA